MFPVFDPDTGYLWFGNDSLRLTIRERQILDEMMDGKWHNPQDWNDRNNLRQYIAKLRHKGLNIEGRYGYGWRLLDTIARV